MVFCVIGVFLVNWQTAAKQVGAQDSMPGDQDPVALSGLSPAIHVRVAHSTPLVGVPVRLDDLAMLT
jgi:hypothetical protein